MTGSHAQNNDVAELLGSLRGRMPLDLGDIAAAQELEMILTLARPIIQRAGAQLLRHLRVVT